jgi:hypothetical protein
MNNEIFYTISEKDFIKAYRLAAKASKKQLIWLYIGGFLLLCLALFGPEGLKNLGWISLGGGAAGYFLTLYFLTPRQAKNHYRNYKSIQGQLSIKLENDGFVIKTEDGNNYAKWDKLLKWRENNQYMLIYLAPKLFYLIPKNENSNEVVKNLKSSLLKNIGQPI